MYDLSVKLDVKNTTLPSKYIKTQDTEESSMWLQLATNSSRNSESSVAIFKKEKVTLDIVVFMWIPAKR